MTLVRGAAPLTAAVVTGERAPSGAGQWRPGPQTCVAAYGAVLGAALFVVARDAMPDDALIHAAYARNVLGGQWGLAPGVPANTATSPLWVWLLALVGGPLGSMIAGIAVLLCAALAALAVALHRLGGLRAALLGTLLVASTPVMTSAVGMETFLAVALLVWLVERAFAGSVAGSTVLTAALVLTRPDLAAAAAAVAVTASLAARRPRLVAALPLGAALTAPWFLFCWVHFGSAWPDTVPLKSQYGGWGAHGSVHLWNAVPFYLDDWPAATWLTLAVAAVGVVTVPVAVRRRRWPALALVAGGVADFALMAASGGPPVSYYAAPLLCGLGLAAVLIGARSRAGWIPVAVVVAASIAFSAWHLPGWSAGFAPLRANLALDPEYAQIADGLPRDGLVVSDGEIGALEFFCMDRGCHVVDKMLADPHATDVYVNAWRTARPWTSLNYAHRAPAAPLPARYLLRYADRVPSSVVPVAVWPITGSDRMARVAFLTRVG